VKNNKNCANHVGEVHGIYTIVSITDKKNKYGNILYICKCNECGFEKLATYSGVSAPSNIVTKCRHMRVDGNYMNHGHTWKSERLRQTFYDMLRRCYDSNSKDYRWYGAKNIGVCSEWRQNSSLFEEWAFQNGYNDNLTIDRIKSDQGYCPENCRWVTVSQNAKYKSTTSMINVDSTIHTGKDWSKILGLGINTINKYVRKYGLDNTVEFIRRYLKNPELRSTISGNQNVYKLYMN
jgi:hypothetical protein